MKYNVYFERKDVFNFDIEAENQNEADLKARQIIDNDEELVKHLSDSYTVDFGVSETLN